MTIVAEEDHRNAAWAKDQSNFGQRMLLKMGWSQGKGLGKNQQGTSTNLKAIRREDGLGIGAKTDTFGDEGFGNTSRNFHGVLAALKEEHTSSDGSKKKKKKKGSKKDKRSDGKQKQKDSTASSSSASEITLATNRVAAGHSRKMRESKDLSKKSKEDMAAIFGMKVESYQSSSVWGKLSNISDSSSSSSLDARKENETQPNEPNEIDSSGGKKSDGTKQIKVYAKSDEDNKTEKSTKKKDKKKRKRTEIETEESENEDVKGKSRDKKKRKKKSKKN